MHVTSSVIVHEAALLFKIRVNDEI